MRGRLPGRVGLDDQEVRWGVARYERDQWARAREVAADPSVLEETYEEWVAIAERAIRTLKAAGESVARVSVNAEELVEWCKEQKRPMDRQARAEFASWMLYEHRGGE
jgi:hypothetical protein